MPPPLLSVNEREFIARAAAEQQRVDGRRPFDPRKLSLRLGPADGTAEVSVACGRDRYGQQGEPHRRRDSCALATSLLGSPSQHGARIFLRHWRRRLGRHRACVQRTRRWLTVSYTTGGGWRQVRLGHTRVLAAVSAELGTPFPDRPTEGALNFLVECPPMGHGGWDMGGKPPDEAAEITRLLERTLRDTGAVDTEALCVLAGRSVRASLPTVRPFPYVWVVDGAGVSLPQLVLGHPINVCSLPSARRRWVCGLPPPSRPTTSLSSSFQSASQLGQQLIA